MNTPRVPSRSRRSGRAGRLRRYVDWTLALTILALLAFAATRLDHVAALQVNGVPAIADGDSLRLHGERIRLRGIDAPEYDQQCSRAGQIYACGRKAWQALTQLAEGRAVTCEGWERDRYGRLLARCMAGGRDLGQAMVESGWAISYGDDRAAEVEARRTERGLWAGSFQTPADWRAGRRSTEEAPHDWIGRVANFLRLLWGKAPQRRAEGGES